ncbi:molecular chaperone Hsp90 [Caproiciproducens sp.]
MDQKVLRETVEHTHELMNAPSCSGGAKAAAQDWLDAIGTGREAAETKKYLDELEADVTPLDGLIALAESDIGIQKFGADTAGKIAAHARELKSAGAKYCDCPACSAGAAILEKKDLLLK